VSKGKHLPPGKTSSGKAKARGFTGGKSVGKASSREAVRKAEEEVARAKRRRAAWELWIGERLTFEQVGARLGVSGKTAWYDCVAHRDELVRAELLNPETLRVRQLGAIDAVVGAHWKNRRKKLSIGLDSPVLWARGAGGWLGL